MHHRSRRHRLTALALSLAVLTAGAACTASKLDQDADVVLTGTVHDAEGQRLSNTPVVLLKEVDFGEAIFGLTFFAATLGTICLTDAAPAICSKARRATTDNDGNFRFQLKGRDTQGAVGTASTFHLSTGLPGPGAPSVSARFQIQRTDLTVPTLRIWDPRLELAGGRTVRATWPQLDPSNTERVVFYDGSISSTDIVWAVDGRSPITLDPRILEDTRGTAVVESAGSDESDGTTFRITHQSRRVDYAGTAGPPPSRDVPCTPEPCPVTDGDLGPPPTAPPTRQEVTVDLTRSRNPTYVVVRGCPGQCDVETSVDGLAWKVVGSGSEPFFTITPVLGTPVRYVKLKSVTDLNRVAELSVWVAT